MENSQLHANYSTMLLALIREHADYFGHSGHLLEAANLSKNELDAILNGTKEISVDRLLKILSIPKFYSQNMIADLFYSCQMLQQYGFYFQYGNVDKNQDDLFKLYKSFFGNQQSIDYLKRCGSYFLISSISPYSTFLHYCINPNFRNNFDNCNFQLHTPNYI